MINDTQPYNIATYGLDDMVDEVITYCQTHLPFDHLLAEVE